MVKKKKKEQKTFYIVELTASFEIEADSGDKAISILEKQFNNLSDERILNSELEILGADIM